MSKKKIINLIFFFIPILMILVIPRFVLGQLAEYVSLEENHYNSSRDCEMAPLDEMEKCYSDFAIKEEDIELCEKAGYYRSGCVRDLAVKEKDINICEKAGKPEDRDYCMYYVALSMGKVEYCEKLSDPYFSKNSCFENLAKKLKDYSICYKSKSKDDCLWRYVYDTRDWDKCLKFENINSGMYSRNYCIKIAVSEGKGSQFCNLIEGPEALKEECRKGAGPEWSFYWLGRASIRILVLLGFLMVIIFGFLNWKRMKWRYRGVLLMLLPIYCALSFFLYFDLLHVEEGVLYSIFDLISTLTIPFSSIIIGIFSELEWYYGFLATLILLIIGFITGYAFEKRQKSFISRFILWLLAILYILSIIGLFYITSHWK